MPRHDTLAAVDLGSNSFHLQIGRVVDGQIYPLDAVREVKARHDMHVCACLGLLTEDHVRRLEEAGVDQVNHNLNSSARFTEEIVSTHTFGDRVATVEHVPSGHLVGFTVLSVPRQLHRAVAQYATLVLKEHRGHKLGMLLKVANLQHLERVKPGHASVTTFNAEENRFMLDVNEAVGFVPIGVESAWRKDLA